MDRFGAKLMRFGAKLMVVTMAVPDPNLRGTEPVAARIATEGGSVRS
jgi:hypothetical protein